MVPESSSDKTPSVPGLLKQYVWIKEPDHISSLVKILAALPIRLGQAKWRTEPDEDGRGLTNLKGEITNLTDGQKVPTGFCRVSGRVEAFNQHQLYLFTGESKRFWPSPRITPDPRGQ